MQKLPFADNHFDVVYSSLVLHHLKTEDKKKAFKEIHRVLKNDGFFLLADFGKPKNRFLIISLFTAIFEVKMYIVWNWELLKNNQKFNFKCLGYYKTHQGNPGLLRSDSMLKAIGKSITVRISSLKSAKIPIIVLGNTPVTKSHYSKVDNLKNYGIIQGFWSLNPAPLDNNGENIKSTEKKGFIRFDDCFTI